MRAQRNRFRSAEPLKVYEFERGEYPSYPGAPFTPAHPGFRRCGYVLIALLCGLIGSFGNALVTTDVANLSGPMGLYLTEASWLPAVYVALNACANLFLIKSRIQFGIPRVLLTVLGAYAGGALVMVLMPGFKAAILLQVVSGVAGATLSTLATYNLLEAAPPKLRPFALVMGISLPLLATPLARLAPVDLLTHNHWRSLALIQLSLPLAGLAAMNWLPLPPTERRPAFERLDLLSGGLLAGAIALLCAFLGQARLLWWSDTPWLGWVLASSVVLFATGVSVEVNRARPLLHLEWIGSLDLLRFAAVALLVRFALAEQTYGAVGFLTSSGLNNDQLHSLFGWVLVATGLGIVAAIATLAIERLPYQIIAAALAIALGSGLDSLSTDLSRPEQLYLSQSLIAFGSTLFLGPALIYGFQRLALRGPDFFISFIVLFGLTQNIGSLAGSTLLGSFQVARAKVHTQALFDVILASDPLAAQRLQGGAASVAGVVGDPTLQAAEGAALLSQSVARQANVLAFNDVFRLVAVLALLTAAYVGYLIIFYAVRRRRLAASGVRS